MDGFDTMTMSYMAAPPMSLSNVASIDAVSMPLLPLENLDHASNFDADTFIGYVITMCCMSRVKHMPNDA